MPNPNSSFLLPGSSGLDAQREPPEPGGWQASARTPLAASMPMSWDEGLPATTGTEGVSPELLSLLLDERHAFSAHQHRELGEWLPLVLTACRSWPSGAGLIWDGESVPHGNEALPTRPWPTSEQPVLRIGTRWTMASGAPDQEWVAVWDGAPWSQGERMGLPPEHGTRLSSADLFDLLAAAVEQRSSPLRSSCSPALPWASANRSSVTGMRLRQELADWLQTPAGRQCPGPRLQPPELEPFDETLAAELATFIREELLPGAGAITPALPPVSGLRPLDEVLHTLRTGGWCELLDQLVPTLLVRLPPTHRCCSRGLSVMHDGHWSEYGWPCQGGKHFRISRRPDGRLCWREMNGIATTYPSTPDSFLEAALGLPLGRLNAVLPGVREELATIMACNRTVMDLRLALAERRYPCDQEMLLRMCLVNGQLTLAGEQLLHPEWPQRPVTAEDLERWFGPGSSALGRRAAVIAAEGISVVDAHRLASPLRPSPAGNALMGLTAKSFRKPQDGGVQLLLENFPELVYACQTLRRLSAFLRTTNETLRVFVPADLIERANRFCAQAVAAERVVMPPDWQDPASPTSSGEAVDQRLKPALLWYHAQ